MIQDLLRPEVQDFMAQYANDDPYDLSLKASKFQGIPVRLAIEQIRVRQKARKKLPEWHARQSVLFPHGVSIEQCSSETTAKYKSFILDGDLLVDLTGGTGVDTFYLSKTFSRVVYVEPNEVLCDCARHNFAELQAPHIQVVQGTAEGYLAEDHESPDYYFLDPSRRDEAQRKVFLLEDCTPDLKAIYDLLLKAKKGAVIKLSPLLDITHLVQAFPDLSGLEVISVENECKEILLILSKDTIDTPLIKATNIKNGKTDVLEFNHSEERSARVEYSMPLKYLYEPNASLMKVGAFKYISERFALNKLHANSHLYTSSEIVEDFPGRVLRIESVVGLKSKEIKALRGSKGNITVRNFPLTVAQIRKKTGIIEGGDKYLFATTLKDKSVKILLCRRLTV